MFFLPSLVIPGQYWRPSEHNNDDPVISGIKRRMNPLMIKNRNLKMPARVPDVSASQGDQPYSVPIRPIPMSAPTPQMQQQQQQLAGSNMSANSVPSSVMISLPSSRQPLGNQGIARIQGPKQLFPSVSLQDTSNAAIKQSDAAQKMPLQLLQQHVNAQGQAIISLPNSASHDAFKAPQDASKQVAFSVQQVAPTQQPAVNQKLVLQSQTVSQQTNLVAVSQAALLPSSQVPGAVTTIINALARPTEVASTQHTILPQGADACVRMVQKPTGKEKHERKKAVKAARDIINEDIRASNQDPLTQCQHLADKIQKEMQQNFLQFHVHQQSIQAIQNQLQQVVLQNQQSKLPQNVMDDIHTRVRNHHTQMQVHYQKLQQLQLLLQQVQLRLTQEQKLSNKDISVQVNCDNKAETETQRGFTSPLILRKQSATNATVDVTSTALSSKMQQALVATPNTGVVGVSVNGPITCSSTPAPVTQTQLVANSSAFRVVTGMSPTQPLAVSCAPLQLVPGTLSSTQNSVNVMSKTSLPQQQVLAGQQATSVNQVQVLANHTAQQASVMAQLQCSGNLGTSTQQFIQVPLVKNVQQSSAQAFTATKTISITHNTPILPRPQSMAAVSNQSPLTLQTSGIPAQTLLFKMPVAALANQTIRPENQTILHQQIPLKQTSMAMLSTSHVILTNSSLLQNKVPATAMVYTNSQAVASKIPALPSAQSAVSTQQQQQQQQHIALMSSINTKQNSGIEQAVPTVNAGFAMPNSAVNTNTKPIVIRQAASVAGGAQAVSLITNGSVPFYSHHSHSNNVMHRKAEVPILTNGQPEDIKGKTQQQPISTQIDGVGDLSMKAVAQNGIKEEVISADKLSQIVSTTIRDKDSMANKSSLTQNSTKTSLTLNDVAFSSENGTTVNAHTISVSSNNVHCQEDNRKNTAIVNKRPNDELPSSIEKKKLKMTHVDRSLGESIDTDISMGTEEMRTREGDAKSKSVDSLEQGIKVPRINGMYPTALANGHGMLGKIPDVDIDELLANKTTATNSNQSVVIGRTQVPDAAMCSLSSIATSKTASPSMTNVTTEIVKEEKMSSSDLTAQKSAKATEETPSKRAGNNCLWAGCKR